MQRVLSLKEAPIYSLPNGTQFGSAPKYVEYSGLYLIDQQYIFILSF